MEESRLLARAVEEFASRTRFPVAFGGLRDASGVTRVTTMVGTRTAALHGLSVAPERGLGGRAASELRPRMTGDYATSKQITHDYDAFILGEGLGTLIAVPIIVRDTPRGILYGGAWGTWSVGGVTTEPAVHVARRLAQDLAERDAAREALDDVDARASDEPAALSAAQREELRESYTELRRIAAALGDDSLRGRLRAVEKRLAALSGTAAPAAPDVDVSLSPRETDVLACVALGSTNAEIAQQLGLREGTVKAYLGSAMAKLDASTRHAAVTAARRLGLMP
ncbi:MAG TPA: LuxR C-terminal-related transcriptional regulator [Microbacterium sp.]|nr:LuxR C-terminal-related transcriptional regulator [Microbacterium sp.]